MQRHHWMAPISIQFGQLHETWTNKQNNTEKTTKEAFKCKDIIGWHQFLYNLDNCMKHGQISKTILRKQQKKHSNAQTSLDGTNSYTIWTTA
jgi:hypothetical protein